jgi:hypothetical protein
MTGTSRRPRLCWSIRAIPAGSFFTSTNSTATFLLA